MRPIGPLLASLLIAACLAPATLADGIRFTAPSPGESISGPTLVSFAVTPDDRGLDRIDVFESGRLVLSLDRAPWSGRWEPAESKRGAELRAVAYAGGRIVDRTAVRTGVAGIGQVLDVRRVQLYPVVFDGRGVPLTNVAPGDFVVTEAGRRLDIDVAPGGDAPLHIVLVLDTSDSVTRRLDDLRSASIRFSEALPEARSLALYAFNQSWRRLAPAGSSPEELARALEGIRAGGQTALFDALLPAIDDIRLREGRKAIVLFSDGEDRVSLTPAEIVIERALAADVMIFAMGVPEAGSKSRADLERLATETGGGFWTLQEGTALAGIFDEVVAHLRSQYRIGFAAPVDDPGMHDVQIDVKGGGRVRSRTRYVIEP